MSVQLLVGDTLRVLPTLPERSVQTCVTSPPYWGLRSYGIGTENGEIGLEKTPEAYVAKMVAVFREVRRVLRDDGTLWLNLGDSYCGAGYSNHTLERNGLADRENGRRQHGTTALRSLKSKDLVGIPWRVAFALQADGWYLRSDIIWAKPNPMPESVTDRPTKAHEYLFLLTKSASYFYDAAAVAEEATNLPPGNVTHRGATAYANGDEHHRTKVGLVNIGARATRNRRSVWTVATRPYKGAHFATFPPKLIEPCILAGTSPQACEHCAAPWERVTEKAGGMPVDEHPDDQGRMKASGEIATDTARRKQLSGARHAAWKAANPDQHIGWQPTCDCADNTGAGRCVVLDPFGGAGTTGLVADRLGRDAILIELNKEYTELGTDRITDDAPLFANVHVGNGNGHA